MRSSTRQLLIIWTSITMLLGQTGCAARGVSEPPPTAAVRERLEPSGTVPTRTAEASRAGRGWATGARTCIKDFVSGKVFDPTVIVMLPLVTPVCAMIGALDIQTGHPPTAMAMVFPELRAVPASDVVREHRLRAPDPERN